MIDLHSHILPGVDDGAKDIEMSLAMLSEAKRQGVEIIAATPHCLTIDDEGIEKFLVKRQRAYEKLMTAISGREDEFPKIILGAEVYMTTDLSELSSLHKLCYQNTDYILVEVSESYKPSQVAEIVYNIQLSGMKPVIAHVERYSKHEEIIEELEPSNVIFQLNAAGFLSIFSRRSMKNILNMHDKFLISSDMHNITTRPCKLQKAKEVIDKKMPQLSKMLFCDMARCVVENGSYH